MKIKIKDINGNWIWYDTKTKQTTSAEVPIGKLTEDSYKKIYSFTFPNGKEIDGIKALRGWNSLINRQPFNKVQYDPATYAEDIWAKQNKLK